MKALLVGLGPTALTALDSLHEQLKVVGMVRNVYPPQECDRGGEVKADGGDPLAAAALIRSLSDTLGMRTADLVERIRALERRVADLTAAVRCSAT